MTPSREKLLNRVRQHSLEHNEPLFIELMNEAGEYVENVNQLMNDSDWLTREGYNFHPASGCGYLVLELTEKGEKFFSQTSNLERSEVSFHFDGATIHNATIGSGNSVGSMVYNGASALSELENVIAQQPSANQAALNEMLDLLRDIQRAQQPIEKSRFARFYELVKNSSDLILPIGKFLFEFVFAPRG